MSTKTALLALPASAVTAHRDAMAEARAAGPEALTAGIGYYKAGAVAVVPVAGMLTHSLHAPAFGVMGYGAIRQALTAALEDQSTSAVLLHINSNGGEVQGLFALADHIRAARGGKPIVALVDETALSAGYALAAASDKIVLASGTSVAGSVGIVAAHWDLSGAEAQAGVKVTLVAAGAHKTDGNPHEPLSAEARAAIEADVNDLHSEFVQRVASWRNLTPAQVSGQEAAIYRGQAAISAQMVDAIAAPDRLVAALQTPDGDLDMTLRNLAAPTAGAGAGVQTGAGDLTQPCSVQQAREIARMAGFNAEQTLNVIDRFAGRYTFEVARSAVMDSLAARQDATQVQTSFAVSPSGHNATSMDNPAAFAEAVGEALTVRHNPSAQISDQARQFAGMGLADIARAVLQRNGRSAMGSRAQIVASAMHSTSDFATILENYARRTLRDAYQAAPSGIRMVARETSAEDFRDIRRVALGEFPSLQETNEAGEFRYGSIGESAETYRVRTYGKIIAVSRQALINDDLQAFNDLARRAGQAARELEATVLADLIKSNPVMGDGLPFFDADHGNLAASGTSIADGLSTARAAMRSQKGIDGVQIIDAAPRVLLVGADRETEAEKALAAVQPARADDFNPFSNMLLAVDPGLNGWGWGLFAEPGQLAALEYAYLGGNRGPEIITEAGFDVDGIKMRVRHDFGAGVIEHRAAFHNPGPSGS